MGKLGITQKLEQDDPGALPQLLPSASVMPRLVPWLLAGGVALAANLGCKPEAAAVIDELRPLAAPRVERARALSQHLTPAPVGDPAFERPSSPVVFVPNHRDELPTAVLVQAEDLENLDKLDFGLRWFALFAECHSLLTTGRLTSRSVPKVYPNVARSYLSKCAALEFVFVVRATKLEPRLFEGDVQMFEIDTGKKLGGFDLRVESEGRTSVRTVSKKSVQVGAAPVDDAPGSRRPRPRPRPRRASTRTENSCVLMSSTRSRRSSSSMCPASESSSKSGR